MTGRRIDVLAGGLRPPARTYASRGLRALAALSLARSARGVALWFPRRSLRPAPIERLPPLSGKAQPSSPKNPLRIRVDGALIVRAFVPPTHHNFCLGIIGEENLALAIIKRVMDFDFYVAIRCAF